MPDRKRVFFVGSFGCFLIFTLFYLRHASAVLNHFDRHGLLGTGVALLSLAIVSAAGGAWALFHSPLTLKSAFSIGLGLPAILLAADFAVTAAQGAPGVAPSLGPLPEGIVRTILDSVQLIVGPVRSVPA